MRFCTTFACVLLGTIWCLARNTVALNQTQVNLLWEEAKECYQQNLLNTTIHGGSSRVRRATKVTPESEQMSENSNIYPFFEKLAMERHRLTKRQAQNQRTPAACQIPQVNCQGAANRRYRNIDGTCNNLNNPLWGSRNRPFNRVTPPAYQDRVNTPRGGIRSTLPNPRTISINIHPDSSAVNPNVTNMVPQFGQFLDHDITMTPEAASSCCQNPRSNIDCWAIPIATNDPFYSRLRVRQRCMDFTRSTSCSQGGVRQQTNAATAFIDGSQIYGSVPQRTQALRSFQGGRLVTHSSLRGFLPTGSQRGIQVQGSFVAGDDRINENPGLAVMHNLFLMEHNRIADEFQRLTGSTNDELIFQETRRVVIALLQNIVYSEYLPIVLRDKAMEQFGLQLPPQGYSGYGENTDPTIFNSFATAAYRFGHSMVAGIIRLISVNNEPVGSYNIANTYFQSDQVTQANGQGYDWILRGLMTQNAPEMDRFVSTGVTNFLFKPRNQDFGGDLVARNIQRGRDHGLPAYNAYRTLCGLPSLSNSWSEKPEEISQNNWNAVAGIYGNNRNGPLDIDLFVGGLIETPNEGGLTGPTFQCLKAEQFRRLKEGDRYFFTHNTGQYAFSLRQIEEIRQQKLSDVICRNSQQRDAPLNAFLVSSSSNPIVSCANRRPFNLRVFL